MNEKGKKAAALRYDRKTDEAPQVVATGEGYLADSITEKAAKNHVPMIEDASLVELLSELNINEAIPEELYQAVAEVFAFIYQADKNIEDEKNK